MNSDNEQAVVAPEVETLVAEGEPNATETADTTAQPKAEEAAPKPDVISEKQYKDNQRTITRLQKEIDRLKEQAAVSPAVLDKLEILERKLEFVAENMGTPADQDSLLSEERPKRTSYRDYAAKVEAEVKQRQENAAKLSAADRTKAEQIGVVLKSTGLPAEDPRFDLVRETWATGDHDGALATARALAVVLKVSPPQPAASQPKSTKTQELKDSGLLKTDAASPSGGGYSNASDIRKAIISGKITAEQASELERQGRW